eukprot:TRINITY_DN5799_c0_g1_i1.p1 TRINITY_DN5799_c0_g1~~TRINITY_DN5799_c0_g1_i1.p1  ORF type:complete len:301 (-),score=66.12 TRINITY_DN5799_c0_g1_i1:119-1021(-)
MKMVSKASKRYLVYVVVFWTAFVVLRNPGTTELLFPSTEPIPKPYAMIIGPVSGGSNVLYNMLRPVPALCTPGKYDPNYWNVFDRAEGGPEYYLQHSFPPECNDDTHYLLEKGEQYLFSPQSAYRIRKLFPLVKLVIVMMDPAERLWYRFLRRGCKSHAPPIQNATGVFESWLTEDYRRLKSVHTIMDQFTSWKRKFPANRILFLERSEVLDAPVETMKRVLHFLDVPYSPSDLHSDPLHPDNFYQAFNPPCESVDFPRDHPLRLSLNEQFSEANRAVREELGPLFSYPREVPYKVPRKV